MLIFIVRDNSIQINTPIYTLMGNKNVINWMVHGSSWFIFIPFGRISQGNPYRGWGHPPAGFCRICSIYKTYRLELRWRWSYRSCLRGRIGGFLGIHTHIVNNSRISLLRNSSAWNWGNLGGSLSTKCDSGRENTCFKKHT